MTPTLFCLVPTHGAAAATSDLFEAQKIQAATTLGMIVIIVALIRLLFDGIHRAERAASILAIWAILALLGGEPTFASCLIAASAGCAIAGGTPAPIWLWRMAGSQDRVWMGIAGAAVVITIIGANNITRLTWSQVEDALCALVIIVLVFFGQQAWPLPDRLVKSRQLWTAIAGALLLMLSGRLVGSAAVAGVLLAFCVLSVAQDARQSLLARRSEQTLQTDEPPPA